MCQDDEQLDLTQRPQVTLESPICGVRGRVRYLVSSPADRGHCVSTYSVPPQTPRPGEVDVACSSLANGSWTGPGILSVLGAPMMLSLEGLGHDAHDSAARLDVE